MVYSVTVTQLIEKMDLKNHTPEIDTDKTDMWKCRACICCGYAHGGGEQEDHG